MADEVISQTVGKFIPKVTMSQATSYGLVFLGIVFFAGALGFGAWKLIHWLRYNKKIVLFKKVGTTIMPVFVDKGWLCRVGIAGDTWLITKKMKKTLPRPRIQMGKNLYWYYEREDGEWINFSLQDFDEIMHKASAYYVDEDMRLQRLGIQKNLENRFKKVTFWQQYGGMIMSLVFLLVITVCLVLIFNRMESAWSKAGEMAQAVKEMANQVATMGARTTSGIVPVG
jgi:hypothetical protein